MPPAPDDRTAAGRILPVTFISSSRLRTETDGEVVVLVESLCCMLSLFEMIYATLDS